MKKFTLIELLVVLAIIVILGGMLLSALFKGGSENITKDKVRENAELWIEEQGIHNVKRFSAAGDSDGDGWGTVTIVLDDGEKIFLQCKSFSGTTCKEVDTHQKIR